MATVTIIPHLEKEALPKILPDLIKFLKDRKVEVRLPKIEAEEMGVGEHGVEDSHLFESIDFVIAMGGDGTALRVARLLGSETIPVFGLNLGKIGFLMQFEEVELYPSLERILAGDYMTEDRSKLKVEAEFVDGRKIKTFGLNEALIAGGEFNRIIELDVKINETFFSRYALDGMIVATPTGSTAYSFSAGGPFVSPDTDIMIMTPICPHSLFNRTVILSAEDVLKIERAKEEKGKPIRLSIDGFAIEAGISSVKISVSSTKFRFIKHDETNFFSKLRTKLKDWDYFIRD